jgi:hypothetical protein
MALQGQIKNAVVTEVAAWEFKDDRGKDVSQPYIGLFNGRENLLVSIDKDCTPPADLAFGDLVNVWFAINQASKVSGDRSFGVLKLKLVNVELVSKAGAETGGSRSAPRELAKAA